MTVVSGVLWVVFGLGTRDWPVVLSAVPSTALNAMVLLTVLRRRRLQAPVDELPAALVATAA
jgi:hypothetical protein